MRRERQSAQSRSVLVGNCADVLPEMVKQKFRSRFADRSNQRARRPQRLRPKPNLVSRCHRVARQESGGIRQALDGSDG